MTDPVTPEPGMICVRTENAWCSTHGRTYLDDAERCRAFRLADTATDNIAANPEPHPFAQGDPPHRPGECWCYRDERSDVHRPEPITYDRQDRWRLIRCSTDLLSQFGTRTEDGRQIVAEWGEPDEHGIYEPTFTVVADSTPEPGLTAQDPSWVGKRPSDD